MPFREELINTHRQQGNLGETGTTALAVGLVNK